MLKGGDKVKCVNVKNVEKLFTLDKVYTVLDAEKTDLNQILVIIEGVFGWYRASRFVKE